MSFLRRFSLELTVLICGAVVMIYEIVGSRVVSPFIGTSTYVWTSLIGVILASLSLGYWVGGRVADRRPDIKVLATVILVAGGLISLTVIVKEIVLTVVAGLPIGLELKSVTAAAILFGPASVALGFVTPYAVKLRMMSLEDSGKTVGRLYALSTVGSIAGTFAAGFLLIPFVGSVRTLYIIAATLIALGLALTSFALTRSTVALVAVLAVGVFANEANTYFLWSKAELVDLDTEYSRIQVFKTTDARSGRPMRALATDPHYLQSAIYLDGEDLAFRYTPYYHLVRHYRPGFERTLMIGGAGYTFPTDYIKEYPSALMDVVEIDAGMTEVARKYFRLAQDPRMNIVHADGRVFLNGAGTGEYQAVFLDAFGSLFTVPYQLTTVEAVRQIHRVLDDRGIVIFNIGSAIQGRSSKFLHAELATYQAVFDHVLLFKVNGDVPDDRTQNLIIVACKVECSESRVTVDAEISSLLSHRYPINFPLSAPILTDDLAPVEYYNSFGQNSREQ
jgi:spermidine synthase